MKNVILLIGMTLLLAMLSGCKPPTPTIFGVSLETWQTLTPQERKEVIKGYNERERIQTQNAPINNAIGAASAIEQQRQWQKNWDDNQMHSPIPMPAPPPMPH